MPDDFILEIGCEEIPARFCAEGIEQLERNAVEIFSVHRLKFQDLKVWGSCRRLVLFIKGLAERQEDEKIKIVGPPARFDLSSEQTKGFAAKYGAQIEDLSVEETERGKYIVLYQIRKGKPANRLLAEILPALCTSISFSKIMRWPQSELKFIRPVRWILSLYGKKTIRFEVFGIKSGSTSHGNPALDGKKITIKGTEQYLKILRRNFVIIEHKERRSLIKKALSAAAHKTKGKLKMDEELIDEVNFLLEYPTVIRGNFDSRFLSLPQPVLLAVLKTHQKYFAVIDEDEKLLPCFLGLRDGTSEFLEAVRRGYETVLLARLNDADFFYNKDKEKTFDNNLEKLKDIIFHERLGSLYEKSERVARLIKWIGKKLGTSQEDIEFAHRAALLSKADLVTEMVGEFPELAGTMGGIYLKMNGEKKKVCQAVAEQYLPLTNDGPLPQTEAGCLLSFADRMDTLSGDFSVGLIPSSSLDPYGLRRQAQGSLRIILSREWDISLEKMIEESFSIYKTKDADYEKAKKELIQLFSTRLSAIWQEEEFPIDEIRSVLQTKTDFPLDADRMIRALHSMRKDDEFEGISSAFKRVSNILRQADFKTEGFDERKLYQREEKILWKEFQEVEKKAETILEKKDYLSFLNLLVRLRQPLDEFFDKVLVMAEDEKIKKNRLGLLIKIKKLFLKGCDFALLQ